MPTQAATTSASTTTATPGTTTQSAARPQLLDQAQVETTDAKGCFEDDLTRAEVDGNAGLHVFFEDVHLRLVWARLPSWRRSRSTGDTSAARPRIRRFVLKTPQVALLHYIIRGSTIECPGFLLR